MKTRTITLCAFCMFTTLSFSQEKFTIKGTTGNDSNGKTVYLYQMENGEKVEDILLDSARIKKGKFAFSGKQDKPHFAKVRVADDDEFRVLILENGKITLDLENNRRGGTQLNNTLNAALDDMQPVSDRLVKLSKELEPLITGIQPEEMMKRMEGDSVFKANIRRYGEISLELIEQMRACVKSHNNSIAGAYLFLLGSMAFRADNVETVTKDASPAFLENAITKQVLATLKTMQEMVEARVKEYRDGHKREKEDLTPNIKIGQRFLDGKLKDMSGKEVALSDYVGKGKYVLIDFWASWCGPCRNEMPNVKAAYEKYAQKGFEVISISTDAKQKDWKEAIEELGMTWTQLLDMGVANTYGIRFIPSTFLVDPDGNVIEKGLRGKGLEETLSKLLQ